MGNVCITSIAFLCTNSRTILAHRAIPIQMPHKFISRPSIKCHRAPTIACVIQATGIQALAWLCLVCVSDAPINLSKSSPTRSCTNVTIRKQPKHFSHTDTGKPSAMSPCTHVGPHPSANLCSTFYMLLQHRVAFEKRMCGTCLSRCKSTPCNISPKHVSNHPIPEKCIVA